MTSPVIIDFIAAGVLLLFALFGAKRGLFRTLAGLAIMLIALMGASFISGVLTAPAARILAPAVERRVEAKVDEALAGRARTPEAEAAFGPEELLDLLGLDPKLRADLAERAGDAVREAGSTIVEAVVSAVSESVIHGFLYILAFFVLTALLGFIARAMDLVLRLPVLHSANALLGGLAGLAEGALLLFLAVMVLRHLGLPLGEAPWSETYFLRIFTAGGR